MLIKTNKSVMLVYPNEGNKDTYVKIGVFGRVTLVVDGDETPTAMVLPGGFKKATIEQVAGLCNELDALQIIRTGGC